MSDIKERSRQNVATPKFLAGGGELGALMRSHDWASTPLGSPQSWPQSLKTAVRIMLTSRQPIWIGWGSELIYLYNDPYKSIIGGKHPWALGRSTQEVWREIWPEIGPMLAQAMGGEEGTYVEQQRLIMHRHGYPEETYYTYSYSPIPDDDGEPGGIICANTDDTRRVIGERQIALLRELAASTTAARSWAEACELSAQALATDPWDLPFAAIYILDREGESLTLAASHGVGADEPATPFRLRLEDCENARAALEIGEAQVVADLARRFETLPTGAWSEPGAGVMLPIPAAGEHGRRGLLFAGLNPYRLFDDDYRGFLGLVAGQISAAIASAEAYEDERRRAEALAEIDLAKTTFFSNVSHEFRTPLTLMLGPLEQVLADPRASDVTEQVDVAHRNGLRLLKLVNTLLDFSRIEAGRTQARYRPTDLGEMVSGLAATFRSATDRAGLKLEVETDPELEPVFVDHAMVERIVLNLLSNAFKFTLEGSITVAVRRGECAVAEIVVADTGVGIPQTELPRLFERFHRVRGAKGRSFEGSGIGLALVHELVQIHGGSIAVESVEGVGSTFRVSLPLGKGHLPADLIEPECAEPDTETAARAFVEEALRWLPDLQAFPSPTAPVSSPTGKGQKVLLADDNADMREYVSRLLTASGFVVATAPDGQAALELIRDERPDLILTDVMMPGLDGFGLLRAVRNDPRLADTPVIMLSARAGEDAAVEGMQAGADDYLSKPFAARELIARVGANLALAAARREAAQAIAARSQELEELNATLEKRVSEALAERKVLADIVEATDALVEVVDKDLRWLAINRAAADEFERRFGARPRVGLSVTGLLADQPGACRQLEAGWKRALEGEAFSELRQVADEHEAPRWLEAKFNALCDTRKRRIGAFQFVYDVTPRIVEQERLAQAEEQLRQAQKMDAMGQLTGGVAHDFNNLLTPIIGALDMLQRSQMTGERERRLIGGALQSADRARVLVQRLLAFARRQPLQPTAVEVGELVEGMADLISSTTGPQIRVAVDAAKDVPPARADQNQLEMALLNLSVNARDAMPHGGTIRISVANGLIKPGQKSELAPGRYIRLSVADTGAGMDQATLARAVEPFFSTKGIGKGTGLGLSMVDGLVRQLGGAMTITSRPGVGTNVELWLPRSEDAPAPQTRLHAAQRKPGHKGVALLVDDEDLVRASTNDMLSELGYDVVEAGSAEQALKEIEGGLRPSVIITDHLMPGMTGIGLARNVQSKAPGTPILIVSGYADLEGVDPDLPRLTKPFLQAELAAALAALPAGTQ